MSWNVTAVGKAGALRAHVAKEFKKVICAEPEQSIAMGLATVIDIALASFSEDCSVCIQSYGSQAQPDFRNRPDKFTHTVALQIETLYGFVE